MVFEKNGVHDPTILQENGIYYLYSTDTLQPETRGVPIRTSKDLIHWKFEKAALDGVPSEAKLWSGATELWAPEVIKVDDEYRMYYSASTFGSTTSFIGLAVSDHPLGPWVDKGEVVKTNPQIAAHNAIDANICYDRKNNQWMVYGSFFGGIYIAEIDKVTGKFSNKGYGKQIAIRSQSVEGAIEGPFIKYNPDTDDYYLFVSFDSLNDFYNIRVGRSKSIDGPYIDFLGNELTNLELCPDKIGTKILGGYQFSEETPLYAPGHNSVFFDEGTKQDYLVHHARKKQFSDEFFLQVRPLLWLSNGWPVTTPYEYTGRIEKVLAKLEHLQGAWEIVLFSQTDVQKSEEIADITMWLEKTESTYITYKQEAKKQLYISGITGSGICFFGKKDECK